MSSGFSNSRQTALITGATGGIGVELAKVFAREGYNLVLVARGEDKLRELGAEIEQKYGIQTRVIAKDLTLPTAPDEIYQELTEAGIVVEALVNQAGFATYGYFTEIETERELQMMQVNMTALTLLTKLFLPGMVERRSGKILNTASTAAFQPGPLMSVYYATKAYVLFLSEGLAEEVRGQGVTVTALCPGPTASGFQERAAMEESRLVQGGLMAAADVAEAAYKGLMAGKTVIIPGARNWFGSMLPRFLPRGMTARAVMNLQKRVGH